MEVAPVSSSTVSTIVDDDDAFNEFLILQDSEPSEPTSTMAHPFLSLSETDPVLMKDDFTIEEEVIARIFGRSRPMASSSNDIVVNEISLTDVHKRIRAKEAVMPISKYGRMVDIWSPPAGCTIDPATGYLKREREPEGEMEGKDKVRGMKKRGKATKKVQQKHKQVRDVARPQSLVKPPRKHSRISKKLQTKEGDDNNTA